ncbi:hypothetical protein JCM1841_003066 [Sporobolomyces salmonicolor]
MLLRSFLAVGGLLLALPTSHGLAIWGRRDSVKESTAYGQCGGDKYRGPTQCPSDFTCTEVTAHYLQCLPLASLQPRCTVKLYDQCGETHGCCAEGTRCAEIHPSYSYCEPVHDTSTASTQQTTTPHKASLASLSPSASPITSKRHSKTRISNSTFNSTAETPTTAATSGESTLSSSTSFSPSSASTSTTTLPILDFMPWHVGIPAPPSLPFPSAVSATFDPSSKPLSPPASGSSASATTTSPPRIFVPLPINDFTPPQLPSSSTRSRKRRFWDFAPGSEVTLPNY